ncbi:hypothetical protein FRC00_008991 [Tulasnella sp. 408]|nr:hypothetical protein FRC00_008991 [Tulasnella sp. 408]
MLQENELAWTEVLLTDEIQPFVQVMESVLDSTPQIFIQFHDRYLELWKESKCHANHQYNTPLFTGDRLAEVGRWMATSLDLGSAEVTLRIADGSNPWVDMAPFILSKFHNTVELDLEQAESVSRPAIDFLSTPLYTDSAGSQHFPVPRLVSLSARVHDPSSVMSML